MTSLKDWKIQEDTGSPNPLVNQKRDQKEVLADVIYRLTPLEPDKQLDSIQIPNFQVQDGYVGSEEFKNILRRYKSRGPESLTPEEQGQLGAAANGFPKVAQFVDQVKQARSAVQQKQSQSGGDGNRAGQSAQSNFPPGKKVAMLAQAEEKNDLDQWLKMNLETAFQFGIAYKKARQHIADTFRDIYDLISYSISHPPKATFKTPEPGSKDVKDEYLYKLMSGEIGKRDSTLEILSQAMRETQSPGENFVAGVIEFMPYMTPVGNLIFADDLARGGAPMIKDMAKQSFDAWADFGLIASGYASKERVDRWRSMWSSHPFETAFAMAAPFLIFKAMTGHGSAGEIKSTAEASLKEIKQTISEVEGTKPVVEAITKMEKAIDADIEAGKPKVPEADLGEFTAIKKTPDVELRNELLKMQEGAEKPITAEEIVMMDRGDLEYHISGGRIERPKAKPKTEPETKLETKPKEKPVKSEDVKTAEQRFEQQQTIVDKIKKELKEYEGKLEDDKTTTKEQKVAKKNELRAALRANKIILQERRAELETALGETKSTQGGKPSSEAVTERKIVEAENELFDKASPEDLAAIKEEAVIRDLSPEEYQSAITRTLDKDKVTVKDFEAAVEELKKPAKEEKPAGEPITQKELDSGEAELSRIETDINQRKSWLDQIEDVKTKDAEEFKLSIKKQMAGLQVELQEANKKMADLRRRPIKEEKPADVVEAEKIAADLGIKYDGYLDEMKVHQFTEPKNGGTFYVKDLAETPTKLASKLDEFEKGKAARAKAKESEKPIEEEAAEIDKIIAEESPEIPKSDVGVAPEIKSNEPAVESERLLEPERYDEAGKPKNRLQSEELVGEKNGDKLYIASYELGDVVKVIEQKDGSKVFRTEKPDGTVEFETEGKIDIPEVEMEQWFNKKESEIGYGMEEFPLKENDIQKELKELNRFAINRSQINIDLKRFQKRLSAFSAASVKRIVSNFEPAEMDPLVIWKDPKDNKYYLLKGHSRFEATGKLGIEELPAVEFKGTEAEAIKFAERSNLGATGYDLGELIDIYKTEKGAGTSTKELNRLFPGKVNKLEAFSHLDPKGMFRRLLEDPAFSDERGATSIDQKSREVGELRKIFPELTNQHEKQIFEALYPTDKKTSVYLKMSKNDFAKFIERQVTDIDFQTNPNNKVLNFGKANVTDLRARPDTKNVMVEIDKLKADIKKLRDEKDSRGAALMIQEKQAKIDKLYKDISDFADKQTDVFGELYKEIKPMEELGGGLGIVNPFKSLNQMLLDKVREIKERRLNEGDLADQPVFMVEDVNDVGASSFVRTLSSLFGIYEGQKPKYGQNAKMVARDIILTNIEMKGKIGERGAKLSEYLAMVDPKDVPRKGVLRRRNWDNFYDHVTDPSRDSELQPSSLKAAKLIREFMQKDREYLITKMRDQIRLYLSKIVEKQYRTDKNLVGKKLKPEDWTEISNRIDAEVLNRYPDDWGYDNYLSQIHPGKWEVILTQGEENSYIGYGENQAQAMNVALRHYSENIDNPNISPDAYTIRGRAFHGGDIDRMSSRKFYKLVNEIAKASEDLTPTEVREFLTGTIGTKEGRKKFAFFKQKREDLPGFTKDLPRVLHVYNQAFVRSDMLSALNRRITPTIDYIRQNELRPRSAEYLQRSFDYLWAKPQSELSKRIDASLLKIPGIGIHIRPMWLERTLGHIKGGSVATFIKMKPTFHLANTFQLYQTTAPTLKGIPFLGEWREGGIFYSSPEGKALREKYNIPYLTGGKTLEGGKSWTSPKFREKAGRFAPETYNQEMAWSIMFKRAKAMGMSDLAANEYALINGCLRTQFLHLESDMMEFARGPVGSTIFQFKRFMVKDLELASDLLKTNKTGFAKWMGVQVVFGGAKVFLKLGGAVGAGYLTAELYDELKKEIGDYPAQVVMYGLPSLIGLDLSSTISVVDAPYGNSVPEQIGNQLLSPFGSAGLSILMAAGDTKGPEATTAAERVINAAEQRFPFVITRTLYALRTLDNKLDSGEYEFKDAAGRVKFRGDLRDALLTAAGGRTVHQSDNDILIEAGATIGEQYDLLLDNMAQQFLKLDKEGRTEDFDLSDVLNWNELHPDYPVSPDAIKSRLMARYKYRDLDRFERMIMSSPKQMRGVKIFEEKMKNFGGQ
jgi:hypothetical protein